MKYILILVSLVFMTGCKNENQGVFETKYIGKGEVFISNEVTSDPKDLGVTDDYLILSNAKNSPLIEIYDIRTGQRLTSFLNIGNGPQEALNAAHMQIDKDQDDAYFFDVIKKQLIRGQLSMAIQDSNYMPEITFTENQRQSAAAYNYIKRAGNQLYSDSKQKEGRIRILDTANGRERYYIDFPDPKLIDKKLTEDQNAELYTSNIQNNYAGDRIGIATLFGEMIDIFSFDGKRMEPVFSYHISYPSGIQIVPMGDKVVTAASKSTIWHFPKTAATDHYFYALYSGKTIDDKQYNMGTEIYVVDWNGEESFKINLDQQVSAIAVSADDNIIYGINKDMDIIQFKLTKI